MRTEASSSDDWVAPLDLPMWALLAYKKRFAIGTPKYGNPVDSYALHYNGALKGLRISVERMDWMVDTIALMRIRGEVPTSK